MATNTENRRQFEISQQSQHREDEQRSNSTTPWFQTVCCYRSVYAVLVFIIVIAVRSSINRKSSSTTLFPIVIDENDKVSSSTESSSYLDRLAVLFATSYSDSLWDPITKLNVTCSGRVCNETATEILGSLNTSIDPCDNFYDFACQRWENENSRPEYRGEWDVLGKLEKESTDIVIGILNEPINTAIDIQALVQAKTYYKKCMEAGQHDDDATVEKMLSILEKFGGWPMLYEEGKWDSSKFNILRSIAGLRRYFGATKVLDIRPLQMTDERNNSILINPPTGSDDESVTKTATELGSGISKDIVTYKDFIVNVSRELLLFKGVKNINETKLEIEAFTILAVQSQIENAAERKNIKSLFGLTGNVAKNITLEKLQRMTNKNLFPFKNKLDLKILLSLLFLNTNIQLTGMQGVIVANLDYLFGVSTFLSEVKPEAIANYLHFQMVYRMLSMVSSSKLKSHLDTLKSSLDGTTKPVPKSEECAATVQKKFGFALGHKFVQKRFPNINMSSSNEDFEQIQQMFNNIKTTYRTLISSSKQLDFLSRGKLSVQLFLNELCPGYPSWIYEEIRVQLEYTGLSLRGANFFEQTIALNEWLTVKKLKALRQPSGNDTCTWSRFIGRVGPYNYQQTVYVPLGILRTPFYNLDLPKSIVYGKLGSILGHELAHGFFGDGWTELKNEKTEVANCLIKYYNNFTFVELQNTNETLNGERTLEENTSDNAGILAAYQAFKSDSFVEERSKEMRGLEKYTDDQLFYIGFAQNWCAVSTLENMQSSLSDNDHSPNRFRVLGALQNSKEFAQAWNCPAGSKMNPELTKEPKTCQLF